MTGNGTDHADPQLVDDFSRLVARMGVSETLVPSETMIRVIGGHLGQLNHAANKRFEALEREVAKLAERIAQIEARGL